MATRTVFRNARLVTADAVIEGALEFADGVIAELQPGASAIGEDFAGDYLIPGLVELHTDHLENHYRPRPGVFWDPMAALQAHDGQIAASGITTVFDAIRIGSDNESPDLGAHAAAMIDAVRAGRDDGRLRVDHFIHLRCELPSPNVLEQFEAFADHDVTRLASMMDHTPGQRQFPSLDSYRDFYKNRVGWSDEKVERSLTDRLDEHQRYSRLHRAAISARARELGLVLASHDDANDAHVAEAVRDGVRVAEFPTTLEAAAASHAAGMAVLMGAPNVVRGKSHSGNISAIALARAGLLDVLSSDYVPFALLQAAFLLPQQADNMSLPQALATVSRNPAQVMGLDDRGELAVGMRADLVRITLIGGTPVVRGVWRQGQRVG